MRPNLQLKTRQAKSQARPMYQIRTNRVRMSLRRSPLQTSRTHLLKLMRRSTYPAVPMCLMANLRGQMQHRAQTLVLNVQLKMKVNLLTFPPLQTHSTPLMFLRVPRTFLR